jgi:hypothetical protein
MTAARATVAKAQFVAFQDITAAKASLRLQQDFIALTAAERAGELVNMH